MIKKINHNVKLARNIEILKMRFLDWRKSGALRRKKDGSVRWGYRQLAKIKGMPAKPAIIKICLARAKWLKMYDSLGK